MSVHHVHAFFPRRPEDGGGPPGTRATVSSHVASKNQTQVLWQNSQSSQLMSHVSSSSILFNTNQILVVFLQ